MMTLPPTRATLCGLDECEFLYLPWWRLFF